MKYGVGTVSQKLFAKRKREAFNILIDAGRNYASAGSNATQPLLLEPMIISMRVSQHVLLQKMQKELADLKQNIS
jgi:hypothetical protein